MGYLACAQRKYPSASPEPWLQFSQTRPHFLQNHQENPVKLWNLKKIIDLGGQTHRPHTKVNKFFDISKFYWIHLMVMILEKVRCCLWILESGFWNYCWIYMGPSCPFLGGPRRLHLGVGPLGPRRCIQP